ncbi:MAG: family 78 glycoside hydrolase catalytic domain [Clostridiales bacterium]|nr:family 78 glycoside hydrolase catalytic domain [Clostridiales bacterium]
MINQAKWICADIACPIFEKEINLKNTVKSATLQITAMGIYECLINGLRVGDFVLAPGWTDYNDHVQYQEYDVTNMLDKNSVISIKCGAGWAASKMGLDEYESVYANHPSCIFSLDIEYENGEKENILSDSDALVYTSDIVKTDIYHGETIDRTIEKTCCGNACEEEIETTLVPQLGELVKEQEHIFPASIFKTPKGEWVVDFGQNMTGYVKVRVKGKRGDRIRINHAEVLDAEGNFYNENMRGAKCEALYIMGGEYEEFKPTFTFYGFRYIRLDEFPGIPDIENFEAIEVHSDMKRTGSFVCGHEGLNRLYSNIIWGQKDNFLDVPTDCPQRNERLGWTGDAQVFVRTAAINFDVEKFFAKWLYDMRVDRKPNGEIPAVIPDCIRRIPQPVSAAWGDSSVVCPWEIYKAYGNEQILKDNFECMRGWVEYMHNSGDEEYLWLGGGHFGDWLGLDSPEGSYKGITDEDLIASCFFAYSASLLVKAGEAIGKDMTEYKEMYKKIRSSVQDYFIEDGEPKCKTQTACVLLINFDLCEDNQKTAELLMKLIRDNGNHLTTGFVGTPYLLHALSKTGNTKTAYDLLLREQYPSWLYSVNHGATTIWEHWDGIKEDGSMWSADMNSFNHYAYGAVFDWIFGVSAGIKVKDNGAGYKAITIEPNPDERLGFADTAIDTRQGKIRVMWRYMEEFIRYEIEIPNGTTADLSLPDSKKHCLCGGKYIFYTNKI